MTVFLLQSIALNGKMGEEISTSAQVGKMNFLEKKEGGKWGEKEENNTFTTWQPSGISFRVSTT